MEEIEKIDNAMEQLISQNNNELNSSSQQNIMELPRIKSMREANKIENQEEYMKEFLGKYVRAHVYRRLVKKFLPRSVLSFFVCLILDDEVQDLENFDKTPAVIIGARSPTTGRGSIMEYELVELADELKTILDETVETEVLDNHTSNYMVN